MPMNSKYLFIFSHDTQIDWYRVFSEGFKELGQGYKTALFVHGKADAERGRKLGCYDLVVDLLEGFAFSESLEASQIPLHPEILRMEEASDTSFFWEDIRIDRWARARNDASYMVQYLNHAFSRMLKVYAQLNPVAALGECTMAFYRLAFRYFERQGKPMFSPIATRYFNRFYFETDLFWTWSRCLQLYAEYLKKGIPPALEETIRPIYEGIINRYTRPLYMNHYQSKFATGYVRLRSLTIGQVFRKVMEAFLGVDPSAVRNNLRLSIIERGPLQKAKRIIRERVQHRAYNRLSAKILPAGLDYSVYFLHYQPEYTSDALGKFYSEQHFLIRNIASSLPAGMFLVVKEHPTMVGLRGPDFYQHIKANSNVILVHHTLDSMELINGSRLVFTIVGTPALEAMLIGKPAIMFGRYAFADTYLISFCQDFWSLNRLIREKLRQMPSESEIRRHGLALLAAKYQASRPGQIPLATELIPHFLAAKDNYETVKQSFREELLDRGILT